MSQHDPNMQQPPQGGGPPWPPQPGSGPPPLGGQPAWGGQPVWGPPAGPAHPTQWGQPSYNPYGGPPPYRQPQYVAPPKPGIIPLRPLMFGEIIDGSFQTIRRNAKAMLGAALLAQSLAVVTTAVLTAGSVASAGSLETWVEGLNDQDMVAAGFAFLAASLLVGVLTVFLSAVLQGAMVVPVARSVLNRTTGFRQMWMLAKSHAGALIRLACLMVLGWLLGAAVFVGLAVVIITAAGGIGALILIPLGFGGFALFIWIYIRILVAPAAVVIEELGAVDGLRRSWQLTRGNWWRVLGITLVVAIMVGIIAQVVTIPVSLLPAFYTSVVSPHGGRDQAIAAAVVVAVITAVVTALVGAVGYAFQTAVMALLYLDLRMRKDGLDIALLRLLESGADPDGVPGRGIPVHGWPGQGGPSNNAGSAYRAWPDVR